MSDDLYNCGICQNDIVVEYLDDIHADDSGEYHYDCWREWADNEERYWSAQYKPEPFKLTAQEQIDAYDPGTVKRYAMEMELM